MAGDLRASSVFINCPFDPPYRPLFDALVFTTAHCGFQVRSALEIVDSGEPRLTKIIKLIEGSRFSIHDISRVELNAETELPRFNMPIELGIAIGMKHLGRNRLRDHSLLVLDGARDEDRFRYQRFASDLAGVDIAVHANEPSRTIEAVRNFLSPHVNAPTPGAGTILSALNEFEHQLPTMAAEARQTHDKLTFVDRLRHVSTFIGRSA